MKREALTDDQVYSLFGECLTLLSDKKEFKALKELESDDIYFMTENSTAGYCQVIQLELFGTIRQKIYINKYLCKKGFEKAIKETMLHELCHYQACKTILKKLGYDHFVSMLTGKNSKYYDEYFGNDGHGKIWSELAAKVNEIVSQDGITIGPYMVFEKQLKLFTKESGFKYVIYCPKCSSVRAFYELKTPHELNKDEPDDLLSTINKFSNGETDTTYACGKDNTPLKIKWLNKNVEKLMLKREFDLLKKNLDMEEF